MNPRQRRAVLLLAIAALGLLGVFVLVANYVSNVNTQVGPKVTVLELTRDAPKNQAITDNMVVAKEIPKRYAPAAALTDMSQVVGFVPSSDLTRNSILQEGMLVTPPQLKPGEREIAILVDASTGVAGQVQDGSRVDIIAAYQGDTQSKEPNRSVVVVSGARVLSHGTPRLKSGGGVQQQDQPTDPTQVVPVTFALTKEQELQVSYAESFAQDVRLGIVPQGDTSTDRTLPETIFKGADPTTGLKGSQ